MKNLKKYVGVLMLLSLLVGFTSCEDDETIFDRIVGRTWIGDLGFESDDRYHDPLVPFILIMVMLLLRVNCVMYMLVMDV